MRARQPIRMLESVALHRDGHPVILETSGVPFFAADGEFAGYRGIDRDITARHQIEAELSDARTRADMLADMLQHSAQPFGQGFPDGRLGLHNQAFLDLAGYSEEEFNQINWATDLTPPEWLEAERAKLEELSRSGQHVLYEKEYIRKDGTRVPIELLVHLICDESGQPKYYYAFITDISERKQAESALLQQAEELENRNEELESFNRAVVGRELDMIKLKKQINALAQELGREPPYDLSFLDAAE
jgi:PAS domain S-box-containing protein